MVHFWIGIWGRGGCVEKSTVSDIITWWHHKKANSKFNVSCADTDDTSAGTSTVGITDGQKRYIEIRTDIEKD